MRGNGWSRGAEEFHALVSGDGEPGARTDLLDVVTALRSVPDAPVRPDFVASLRSQLVAAAEREPVRADQALAVRLTPRQRRGSRERRLAALVGGFAVVSASGSMAMASQAALPGDVLYPVKRAIENAQTNLQPDGASKAETLLTHAASRLDEVGELTARRADAATISTTLQDFTDQSEQASELTLDDYSATGRASLIADLRTFAAESMDLLGALGPIVPADSRASLITATQTIRQIDAAAWEACAACADGGITEIPDFATQPLSAILSGDLPEIASVTQPTKKTKKPAAETTTAPEAEAPQPGETSTDGGTPAGADSIDEPSSIGGNLGKTLEGVADGVDGNVNEPDSTTESSDSLTGTLVDGLGGLLGTLGLGGK